MVLPTFSISVRPISNGYILSGSVGAPYGKSERFGETYFPDLPSLSVEINKISLNAEETLANILAAEESSKKKG